MHLLKTKVNKLPAAFLTSLKPSRFFNFLKMSLCLNRKDFLFSSHFPPNCLIHHFFSFTSPLNSIISSLYLQDKKKYLCFGFT